MCRNKLKKWSLIYKTDVLPGNLRQSLELPNPTTGVLYSPLTMSGKLQSTAALEESSEQPNQCLSTNHNNNPFLNIIASFTKLFNLVFHPQKKEKNQAGEDSAAVNKVKTEPEPEPEPMIVRFPLAKIESVPPLTLEREEQNTNSLVLWQVSVASLEIYVFFRWIIFPFNFCNSVMLIVNLRWFLLQCVDLIFVKFITSARDLVDEKTHVHHSVVQQIKNVVQ